MKLEALAFVRILPPGAADVGDVSREDLRDAGAGTWSARVAHRDDVGCLFDEVPEAPPEARTATRPDVAARPAELPPEFDYVVPTTDEKPAPTERVVTMRFGTHG